MENLQNNSSQNNEERALELYRLGNEAWKKGDKGKAMSFYSESAAINPNGPGKTALEMTRQIMDFYDKNQFNP